MALPSTLYHAQSSFFSQRVKLSFEEKALKYKGVEIAIVAGEQLEPWYARIHPLMTVPSLVIDTGAKFIDSEAIIGYLDKITPELPPLFLSDKTPEGQKCNYYLQLFKTISIEEVTFGTFLDMQYSRGGKQMMSPALISKSLNKSIEMAKHYSEKYPDLRYEYLNKAAAISARLENITSKSSLKSRLDDVEKVLTEIEEELEKVDKKHEDTPLDQKPWLCDKHFNAADLYFSTLLHRLVFVGYSHFWTNGRRPHIDKYYQRVLRRKSFQRSCQNSNSLFWAVQVPTMRYKLRCMLPWLLGATGVAAAAAAGIYISYKKQ